MIYLIDSRYFDAELVANYNFWKFNVLKNDVAGKKIEIHGNENSLIAISNKYSVNFAYITFDKFGGDRKKMYLMQTTGFSLHRENFEFGKLK